MSILAKSQVAHPAGAFPSMKQRGVLLIPTGWNAISPLGYHPPPPAPHSISSESPKIRQYPVINLVFFTNFTLEIFNLNCEGKK